MSDPFRNPVRCCRAVPGITVRREDRMGRKILFITTDQMRYDALGCNGGKVARTAVLGGDSLRGREGQTAGRFTSG